MRHITDAEIERLVSMEGAIAAMDAAFRQFAKGDGAMQPRSRAKAGKTVLSTMGAVLPQQNVAGAKIYTTYEGRFSFVILLFSTEDGRPLALLDGNAMTGLRTAAVSAVAARALARPEASTLTVFGTGVQALAHVRAMVEVRPIRSVRVVSRGTGADFVENLRRNFGLEAKNMPAAAALDGTDIIVTATRAAQPLFPGSLIPQGAFIAAIGSSKPDTRELDDTAIARCNAVVVEWKTQVPDEAGDLIQAAAGGAFRWESAIELGEVLTGLAPGRKSASDIILYKSVGVGLEDVALAELAYRKALAS